MNKHYRVNETLGGFTKSVVTSGVQRLTIVIMEPVVISITIIENNPNESKTKTAHSVLTGRAVF